MGRIENLRDDIDHAIAFGKSALETVHHWKKIISGEFKETSSPFGAEYELNTFAAMFRRVNGSIERALIACPDCVSHVLDDKINELHQIGLVIARVQEEETALNAQKNVYLTLPREWCQKGEDYRILLGPYAVKELLDVEARDAGGLLIDQGKFKFKKGPDMTVYPGPGKRISNKTLEILRLFFTSPRPKGRADLGGFENPRGNLRRVVSASHRFNLAMHLRAEDEDGNPVKPGAHRKTKWYCLVCEVDEED